MSGEVPDVAGVIVGWRTWRILGPRDYLNWKGEPLLDSRAVWPRDGHLKARHVIDGRGDADHTAPDPHCVCGIYAVASATDLVGQPGAARRTSLLGGRSVAGKVALWGRVIEHEHGWRAEYARPVGLAIPPHPLVEYLNDLRVVQERYGLPSVDDEGLFAALQDAPKPTNIGMSLGISTAQFQAAMEEMRAKGVAKLAAEMENDAGSQRKSLITSKFRRKGRP